MRAIFKNKNLWLIKKYIFIFKFQFFFYQIEIEKVNTQTKIFKKNTNQLKISDRSCSKHIICLIAILRLLLIRKRCLFFVTNYINERIQNSLQSLDTVINRVQRFMSKFNVQLIREVMDKQENIRNMSVIAHVDHGKSTLTDALLCRAGLISEEKAGDERWTDKDQLEKEKGITIKSTGVSMCFDFRQSQDQNPEQFLINLIDSPGHVDFSSEVTSALRVTDGALVVVDTVEGVCVQTETVLRQAMQERIRPILIINKVDRAIIELKNSGEEIYQNFNKVIDVVNSIVSSYQSEAMGDLTLDPTLGNVAFGAGKDQWAFTLTTFAKIYSKKYGISQEKMMKKLWGDNYFDTETRKWRTESTSESGKPLKRAFVQFIMDPIIELFQLTLSNNKEELNKKLEQLEIALNEKERALTDKKLMKTVMRKWISAADCLVEMMIKHLPSPVQAQKYRASYLYEGNQEQVLESIKSCNNNGPLMVYISKMVQIDEGRFAAFGRIFSGTAKAGEKVKIIGPNYREGSKDDYFEKNMANVMVMIGNKAHSMGSVPCGNTIAITGIDNCIAKTCTISSMETKNNNFIRPMKFSVSPVFRVAVKPVNQMDMPQLSAGLQKLCKIDSLVQWTVEETGENVIAGCGELHMEICVHELKKLTGRPIEVSEPIVSYRQTILEKCETNELVKTNNKQNRIWGTSEPIHADLVTQIENNEISEKDDAKERSKKLVEKFGWQKDDSYRIWSFEGPNLLVDKTKGVQGLVQIKDSICTAFTQASKQGVLAGQAMRGIRFNIVDAQPHPDPAHRKAAQILPATKRLLHGLQLKSRPTLLEPIFLCEITAPSEVMGGIYQTLNQRRGQILEENQLQGSLNIVKAYLPVSESYGFSGDLRGNTQGKAFPQCFFDHWDYISGVPLEDAKADELVTAIRKRKGMKPEIPNITDLLDKL